MLGMLIEAPSIRSILVMSELKDVFPNNLPVMPTHRDIYFCINLESCTRPISIPPYSMAPPYFRDLKSQIQDFLDKGFILPSVSPWGAPVLLLKRRMVA